jgi:hypothetical protein
MEKNNASWNPCGSWRILIESARDFLSIFYSHTGQCVRYFIRYFPIRSLQDLLALLKRQWCYYDKMWLMLWLSGAGKSLRATCQRYLTGILEKMFFWKSVSFPLSDVQWFFTYFWRPDTKTYIPVRKHSKKFYVSIRFLLLSCPQLRYLFPFLDFVAKFRHENICSLKLEPAIKWVLRSWSLFDDPQLVCQLISDFAVISSLRGV